MAKERGWNETDYREEKYCDSGCTHYFESVQKNGIPLIICTLIRRKIYPLSMREKDTQIEKCRNWTPYRRPV